MNASAPGPVTSQEITRFERRSLIPGYEPEIIVFISSLLVVTIVIRIKRKLQISKGRNPW
jgi:hypothetical protein